MKSAKNVYMVAVPISKPISIKCDKLISVPNYVTLPNWIGFGFTYRVVKAKYYIWDENA